MSDKTGFTGGAADPAAGGAGDGAAAAAAAGAAGTATDADAVIASLREHPRVTSVGAVPGLTGLKSTLQKVQDLVTLQRTTPEVELTDDSVQLSAGVRVDASAPAHQTLNELAELAVAAVGERDSVRIKLVATSIDNHQS